MTSCVNCQKSSDGHFCPDCGQNLQAKSISLKVISSEITDRWLGLDTKFGRTVRDLTIRPSKLIDSYLNRNTVLYVGPLGYFIVISALLILTFDLFGVQAMDLIQETNRDFGLQDPKNLSEKQKELQDILLNTVSSNFRIMTGLVVPFAAIGLKILFRKGKNYFENLVISLFLHSHTIWITIASVMIISLTGTDFSLLQMLIGLAYFTWAAGSYYRRDFKRSYLRAAAGWAIGLVLFMISTGVCSGIYILIFYL